MGRMKIKNAVIAPNEKIAYSVAEAAEALSFSRQFIYRLMASGQLRYTQIGSRRIIPRTWLLEFVEGRTERPASEDADQGQPGPGK